MRGILRSLLLATVALTLSAATITTASAGGDVLDSFCSESGDYCTYVVEKDSGAILFQIRAFADYFGRSDACVKKDTEVCNSRSPHRDHHLFEWSIRWQGNYPDQGSGRYAMRWINESGSRIGPVLHFQRG